MYSNILENQIKQLYSCIDNMCTTDNTVILYASKAISLDCLSEIYRYNLERLNIQMPKSSHVRTFPRLAEKQKQGYQRNFKGTIAGQAETLSD